MQVLFDSCAPGFNLVLVLIQDLLLQSLLEVTALAEDARKCYVQFITFTLVKCIGIAFFLRSHFLEFTLSFRIFGHAFV